MNKILFTLALFLVGTNPAYAYFNDAETGAGTFSAGSVAFTMTATTTSNTSGDFEFAIENTGTHLPQYALSVASTTCASAVFGVESSFEGMHMVHASVPSAAASCSFTVVVNAWQQGFAQGSGGFTASSPVTFTVSDGNTVHAGDVVINEVMWMGSHGGAAEEWVELRNMTNKPIDLAGWKIKSLGTNSEADVIIPTGVITAHGYFLIANNTATSSDIADTVSVNMKTTAIQLTNPGEKLSLLSSDATIVDSTPVGTWAAGSNSSGKWKSMERNSIPGDGSAVTSWHTCIDSGCASVAYWDAGETNNYGTPGGTNLSSNDPTANDYIEKDWSYTVSWESDANDAVDDSELITPLSLDTSTALRKVIDTTAEPIPTTSEERAPAKKEEEAVLEDDEQSPLEEKQIEEMVVPIEEVVPIVLVEEYIPDEPDLEQLPEIVSAIE